MIHEQYTIYKIELDIRECEKPIYDKEGIELDYEYHKFRKIIVLFSQEECLQWIDDKGDDTSTYVIQKQNYKIIKK